MFADSRPATTTCPDGGSVTSSPSPVRPMPSHQPLLTRQSTSTPLQTPTIVLHRPPEEVEEDEPRTFEHFKFRPNGGSKIINSGTDVELSSTSEDCFSRNRWRMVTFVAIVCIVTGAVLIYMLISQII
uniref:Membrane protein US9 n=1 Tax=Steinernema glaseri TaxID=37863 RepID=A0A1I8AKW9_9BILA